MGRLLAPHLLIGLLVSNLFLRDGVYLWAMAAQSAWYGLALLGWAATRRAESRRVPRIPSARMPGRFDAAGDTAAVNDAEEKAA
jgi:hypothetical protein